MKTCYFCQGDIEDGKAFHMQSPDKTEADICQDCMNDVLKFFNEGGYERNDDKCDARGDDVPVVNTGLFSLPILPTGNPYIHSSSNGPFLGFDSNMKAVALSTAGRRILPSFENFYVQNMRVDYSPNSRRPETRIDAIMFGAPIQVK